MNEFTMNVLRYAAQQDANKQHLIQLAAQQRTKDSKFAFYLQVKALLEEGIIDKQTMHDVAVKCLGS